MAVKKPKVDPIGKIAIQIYDLKCMEKGLDDEIKALEKQRHELEEKLHAEAIKAGLTKGGDGAVSWDIKEETVPNVKDKDAFYRHILDNEAMHLLQCRPAVLACREMWELGDQIPGLEKFAKFKVTVKGV